MRRVLAGETPARVGAAVADLRAAVDTALAGADLRAAADTARAEADLRAAADTARAEVDTARSDRASAPGDGTPD